MLMTEIKEDKCSVQSILMDCKTHYTTHANFAQIDLYINVIPIKILASFS